MSDKIEERRKRLLERRAELTHRIEEIEHELHATHSADWEEQAIEREEDEMLEGMGSSSVQEMRRIDAALARIAEGTYGACVRCGAEIAPQRLDLLPETPFCAACAS